MVYSIGKSSATSISSQSIQVDDFTCTSLQKMSTNAKTSEFNHHHSIYCYGPLIVFEYIQEAKIDELATTDTQTGILITIDAASEPRVQQGTSITFRLEGSFNTAATVTDLHGIPFSELENRSITKTIPNDAQGGLGFGQLQFTTTTAANASANAVKTGGLYDNLRIVFTRRKFLNMSKFGGTLKDDYGDLDLSTVDDFNNTHP